MRKYSQVSPRFWTGETGRKLRSLGPECQVVALYLMTCPSSTSTGLFYLPLVTLAHEIGSPLEGASKALRRVCSTGFALYDEGSETVFLPEMAKWQLGRSLSANDKRVKGIEHAVEPYRKSPLYGHFWELYGEAYCLDSSLTPEPLSRGFEGASKGLRRGIPIEQEQEQEQENEQEQEVEVEVEVARGRGAPSGPPPPPAEVLDPPLVGAGDVAAAEPMGDPKLMAALTEAAKGFPVLADVRLKRTITEANARLFAGVSIPCIVEQFRFTAGTLQDEHDNGERLAPGRIASRMATGMRYADEQKFNKRKTSDQARAAEAEHAKRTDAEQRRRDREQRERDKRYAETAEPIPADLAGNLFAMLQSKAAQEASS